jgi:hypothetical protein
LIFKISKLLPSYQMAGTVAMFNYVNQMGATRAAQLIANRQLLSAELLRARVDVAEVRAHKRYEQFIGGAALAELRGRIRAIAKDPSLSHALSRRQDDGDG